MKILFRFCFSEVQRRVYLGMKSVNTTLIKAGSGSRDPCTTIARSEESMPPLLRPLNPTELIVSLKNWLPPRCQLLILLQPYGDRIRQRRKKCWCLFPILFSLFFRESHNSAQQALAQHNAMPLQNSCFLLFTVCFICHTFRSVQFVDACRLVVSLIVVVYANFCLLIFHSLLVVMI